MGIRHDFDKVHGGNGSKGSGKSCENDKNFMSYGDKGKQQQWSACSRKDFAAHYLMITKGGIDWCLDSKLLLSLNSKTLHFYMGW